MKVVFVTIALGAAVVAAPALAQAPGAGWAQRDQTRAEVKQRADMLFQMLDANHDGTVTRAEAEQAQAAAYRKVEAEVDDQAPLIPWSYDESSWLVRPGLQGLGTLTIGLLDFGLVSRS